MSVLCLSLWFPFAHAWIFYQRGLIRIKCLKAFQTPGDLNTFWLDLQTKQTIMMQACVKMYTAVKQHTPVLDVFINVLLLSTGSALNATVAVCLLKLRNGQKQEPLCPGRSNSNFPRDRKGDCRMFYARRNQKYSNIPAVGRGKGSVPAKVYFLGRYNKLAAAK